ncbi:MAG: glycerophosphodiester phosphodiesterase family protein [Planctomycetota bacterium]
MGMRVLAMLLAFVSIRVFCVGQEMEPEASHSPIVLGHRGIPCLAPENSIPSFREALALGADGSELDVFLAKSGEVVVIHDPMIDRVTHAQGMVADMTLEEIRSFPLNPDPGGRYKEITIPTLEELFQAFGKEAVLFIEMKRPRGMADAGDDLEDKVGALIDRYDLHDTTFVSSFNPTALAKLKKGHPRVRTIFEYSKQPTGFPDPKMLAAAGPVYAVGPDVASITKEMVQWARKEGFHLSTYSPATLEEMERVADFGFDIITTMKPHIYKMVLAGIFKPESLAKIPPVFRCGFENVEGDSLISNGLTVLTNETGEGEGCLSIPITEAGGCYIDLPAEPNSAFLLTLLLKMKEEKTQDHAEIVGYLVERERKTLKTKVFTLADTKNPPDSTGLYVQFLPPYSATSETTSDAGWQKIRFIFHTTHNTHSFRFLLAGFGFRGAILLDEFSLRCLKKLPDK